MVGLLFLSFMDELLDRVREHGKGTANSIKFKITTLERVKITYLHHASL